MEFGRRGGLLDITAAPGKKPLFGMGTSVAVARLLEGGVDPKNITLSSDGNGSMPSFNEKGEMTGMRVGPLDSVVESVVEMLRDGALPREQVFSFVTANPAAHLKLPRKGRLKPGFDSDLIISTAPSACGRSSPREGC